MSEPSSKPDLSFATTNELLDELARRHRPCVFLGIPKATTGGGEIVMGMHSDTLFDLMGMTEYLNKHVSNAAIIKYSRSSMLYRHEKPNEP